VFRVSNQRSEAVPKRHCGREWISASASKPRTSAGAAEAFIAKKGAQHLMGTIRAVLAVAARSTGRRVRVAVGAPLFLQRQGGAVGFSCARGGFSVHIHGQGSSGWLLGSTGGQTGDAGRRLPDSVSSPLPSFRAMGVVMSLSIRMEISMSATR